jgi:hypothetical protein
MHKCDLPGCKRECPEDYRYCSEAHYDDDHGAPIQPLARNKANGGFGGEISRMVPDNVHLPKL